MSVRTSQRLLVSTLQKTISPRHTHVVQLAGAGVHSLEKLINFIVAHLLAEVRENVAELAHSDKPCEFLIEYLETAAVFFRLAGVAEAAGTVENALEVVEVD